MDRTELDEGLTWEGLLKGLKDRLKAEVEVQGGTLSADDPAAWRWLLWLLHEERSFFGLKKGPGGRAIVFKERSSKKVLDTFFEKARAVPILRSG